jgi:glycosyltransferase involved in cell wall biosynthesis
VEKQYPYKILFISHSYPPIIGGVESQNLGLFTALSRIADCRLIANKNRRLIPVFMFYAALKALCMIQKYDIILLGSGVLGMTGWIIKRITKKPVVAVIHGLDLTYNKAIYQRLWPRRFIASFDKLIAVGNETIKAGIERGIPEERFIFIPNGIEVNKYCASHSRDELGDILKIDTSNKKLLLTSGRLVKRKGVTWFIRNVLPKLDPSVIYIVAGDGPDKKNIIASVSEACQKDRVLILGQVSDQVRNILFNTCDVFIQPNIKVPDDIEGFGISVLEAASCKMPVVASRLEGLQDSIKDGDNGFLVEPECTYDYILKIKELLADESFRTSSGEKARQHVIDNYQWDKIAVRYLNELKKWI